MVLAASVGGCALIEDIQDLGDPEAAGLFGAFAAPAPDRAAAWALDPYDSGNRAKGIRWLAQAPFAGDDVYMRLFEDRIDAEREPDPVVRAAAAMGLANHGDSSHAPLLAKALADEDRVVRLAASRALQRVHAPGAVDAMLVGLQFENEEHSDVRAEIADALGSYAERRVLDALVAALRDPSLNVNVKARRSLGTLTGQDLGDDTRDWLAWLDASPSPFAERTVYEYPVFTRARRFWEWIPLLPAPPVEPEGEPSGFPYRELEAQRVESLELD